MTLSEPSVLYHYCGISNRHERVRPVLLDNRVWLSSSASFNDPFEGRFAVDTSVQPYQLKDWAMRVLEEQHPQLDDEARLTQAMRVVHEVGRNLQDSDTALKIRQQLNQNHRYWFGIFSMTRKRDDLLMWAHYADAHTGLCLEFTYVPGDSLVAGAQAVQYDPTYPVLNPFTHGNMKRFEITCLTKSPVWKYEDEWRFIALSPEEKPDRLGWPKSFNPAALTGIILGARVADEDIEAIRTWLAQRRHPVTLYHAQIKADEYFLDIEPVDTLPAQ